MIRFAIVPLLLALNFSMCKKNEVVSQNPQPGASSPADRKSTRLNSSHGYISYAVFCLKKKKHVAKGQSGSVIVHGYSCWRRRAARFGSAFGHCRGRPSGGTAQSRPLRPGFEQRSQ